jgi:Protein of unknown function (DUF2845)
MKIMATLAVVLALTPLQASADENFRCGKWIVTSDMTVSELSSKCGAPTAQESTTQDVLVRNRNNGLMRRVGETLVETWTYDRGNHAAAMVVTIVDGKIKSLDRKQ